MQKSWRWRCLLTLLLGVFHGSTLNAADGTLGGLCGNAVLDAGEQCDDGNEQAGDGCSESCQVEGGYSCSDPVGPDLTNLVADPGFEAGLMGGIWMESSFNFGTPICSENDCGQAAQRSGLYWVWFGGIDSVEEEAMVSQVIAIPETASQLSFWLRIDTCDSPSDYLEVLVGNTQVWVKNGNDALCGVTEYSQQLINISGFADGGEQEIAFHSETFSSNGSFSDFHIDDVELIHGPTQAIPSICTIAQEVIFFDGFETAP